jgi:DNA-directed RNA polymerase subunit M
VIEKNEDALPKTKATCSKCSHNEAVWWVQQTRSADEAPTVFYRCTKCKHSWREYG